MACTAAGVTDQAETALLNTTASIEAPAAFAMVAAETAADGATARMAGLPAVIIATASDAAAEKAGLVTAAGPTEAASATHPNNANS